MIARDNARRILCFGDSNTFGQRDNKDFTSRGRLAVEERWTGILQNKLGNSYEIIEEGLGGRLTDIDDVHVNGPIYKPPRNGLEYYQSCVYSLVPLDLIIIMLGTNDLKFHYKRNANEITNGVKKYIEFTKRFLPDTKIMIMAPVILGDEVHKYYPNDYKLESIKVSKELVKKQEILAKEFNCLFHNSNNDVKTGYDNVHLSIESHKKLAASLAGIIQNNI